MAINKKFITRYNCISTCYLFFFLYIYTYLSINTLYRVYLYLFRCSEQPEHVTRLHLHGMTARQTWTNYIFQMQHWSTVGYTVERPLRVLASVSAILVAVFVPYSCAAVRVYPVRRFVRFVFCINKSTQKPQSSLYYTFCTLISSSSSYNHLSVSICNTRHSPTPYRARAGYTTR